jgi:hypothetical protein
VAAGIGLVGRHVAYAGLDRGLDLARTQAPELALRGAYVGSYLVFHFLRQAGDPRQAGEGDRVDVERRGEARELGLAVGLRRGDFGRAARSLHRQHGIQLGALGGGTACRRSGKRGHERRDVAVEVVWTCARQARGGGGASQGRENHGGGPGAPAHDSCAQ